MKMTASTIARFWSKVDKNGPVPAHRPELGPCWVWMGWRDVDGYGSAWTGSRSARTHRVAYAIEHDSIPAGMDVCHHCDNPPCVNPDHLWLGTNTENQRDKILKGRQAQGDTHGSRTRPDCRPRGEKHFSRIKPECLARGANNSKTKLTEDQVREIRDKFASGVNRKHLAEEYGVVWSTIDEIVKRTIWAHVA